MTELWPRVRLFALLALLAPLFLGLQYLVQESVPQIEVRFIAPDAQAAAQPPAERVVERVVYVPVQKTEPAQIREPGSGLSQITGRSGEPVKQTGMDSVTVAAAPVHSSPLQAGVEQPAAEPVADEVTSGAASSDEPTVHMGVIAAVTPVVAPVVAAAPPVRAVAAQPRYVAPVVVAAVPVEEEPEEAEEVVAEEPTDEAPMVADAEPLVLTEQVTEISVLETMVDGSQTTRVVSYKVPVHRPAVSQPDQSAAAEPEAVTPGAAEEADDDAASQDEAAVADEADGPDEAPVGFGSALVAIEEEPVAEAAESDEPTWDADEVMEARGPAGVEGDEPESFAIEVAEDEPTEPTVSVTTLIIEQGQ